MDFMDIAGALSWGDGSNEKLHCALFSPSPSKKKKWKKKKTTEDENLSQQLYGHEQSLTHPKKMKGKFFENEDFGEHDQTRFQVNLKKAKRKSLGKEELGGHETPEKKIKKKSFDKEEHNDNFKRFKQTDTVNGDDKSGRKLENAVSTFADDRGDAEHGRRKKRKRKPRNNKFEGWAKKGISQPSEEVNGVEEKNLRFKGDGSVWNDEDKEDLPNERKIAVRIGDKGEVFKVNHIVKGYVEEKSEGVGEKKNKGKREGREDEETEEGVHDTKHEEKVKGKLSESDNKEKYKTADDIRKKQEENLAMSKQNCADKQLLEEKPKIIYADRKQRGKVTGDLGDTGWEQQLRSARFRFINETLYKSSGAEAFKNFKGDRAAFEVYHEGYSQQVQQWPENPVDIIIKYLKKRPNSWIVGDFGCGEAKIAQSVHQKVLSFDIFRANDNVTVCNISKVPLRTESLDVAVYCLSLMGSNWPDYLREGNRVLKKGGLLKIAEVASRFKSVDSFVSLLGKQGFTLKGKDLTNKMFYMFDFEKKKTCGQIPDKMANILKPCKYKRR